jgi:predicted DNA-binding helix-hairpin-helix protein
MILAGMGFVAGVFLCSSPALAGQATDPHTGGHGVPVHGQHVGELDINSASLEELRQLPGINEASAKKIVENRPYARADELITKKVLPRATFDGLKGHIAAKPGAAAKPGSK